MQGTLAFVLLAAAASADVPLPPAVESTRAALAAAHPADAARLNRGVAAVARLWRAEDGDPDALAAFVKAEFVPEGPAREALFTRLETAFEALGGHFVALTRDLRWGMDVDIGPAQPIDSRLAAYDPAAHLTDDLFANKIAFVILLNFPPTTLDERMKDGMTWSRRQWAEARLAQNVRARIPAEVRSRVAAAYAAADDYINGYNIQTHHLLTAGGERLFPAGQRLISHWNLRDELKARYAAKDGLPAQRILQKVMERIVTQEIPAAVIDNPALDWEPFANKVTASRAADPPKAARVAAEPKGDRENDVRYARWKAVFDAERLADPHSPDAPTHIARRFDVDREIPEPQFRRLLEDVLESPLGPRVAKLVQSRLGRPLEPFDIWYAGFKPRAAHSEADLDALTKKRYPTAAAFAADMPRLLRDLGFTEERARFLSEHIEVDPSRGAGHAMGAGRRADKAHLRTRVGKDGMDYKGYNIAVHEMGHNVEQVFSLNSIDHTLLQGVPNTAFTEALAFVFQGHDMELLGLSRRDAASEASRALEEFWATREIAGVGLVDMEAWHWLYEHPAATPAAFREAVVRIARDVWNRHFATLLGARDVPLLAVYSHMVASGLYTPDYPLGHLIAFQVEEHFKKTEGPMGAEFERICRLGRLTPDAWMRKATGAPVSAQPLLAAAERALGEIK